MADIFLGGTTIRSVEWNGITSVAVTFHMSEFTGRLVQLYAGRRLVGVTSSPAERTVSGPVPYGPRATPLSLIVVNPADRLTDFGSSLGWHPWNVYCVRWLPPAVVPADMNRFQVSVSRSPGASVDLTNVVGEVPYDSALSEYSFELPPFAEGGDFEVAVVGRDDAKPAGNAGSSLTETIPVVVYPLDLPLDQDGRRFTASVNSGVLTANFQCP